MLSDSENEGSVASNGEKHHVPINNEYWSDKYDISQYHAPLPIQQPITAYKLRHQQEAESEGTKPVSSRFDYSKISSSVLTTAPYEERVFVLNKLNRKSQYISPLQPMSAYVGKRPDSKKDPYDRRKVKQLDDISFESDNESEEIKNLRRLPETVLTEESLKEWLSKELRRLCLDNHFWIKNNFIDKIGRMAPNLVDLSLRGLKVDTPTFVEMVKHMGLLKVLDISNCTLLDEQAIIRLAETNKALVQFKALGCKDAITDTSLSFLVQNSKTELEIMDISYCSNLTDIGIKSFAEHNPNQIFTELYLNGITGVSNEGFTSLIGTCTKTLILLNMSLNDQITVTGEIWKIIGKWFDLEILDITGWSNIGDDGLNHLATGSVIVEEKPVVVGLKKLQIFKMNSLDMINDGSLVRLLRISDAITHLELSACKNLTEYFFSQIEQVAPQLQFLDMNMIEWMPPKLFDEFKEKNPRLNIRRFMHQQVDPKDNGLRRPLKLKSNKPKKKKKAKKKKK